VTGWRETTPLNESIFVAEAHRADGKHFVVHADEKLMPFVELESAIRGCGELSRQAGGIFPNSASLSRS
jgi:hypothetical protein